MLTRWWWVYLAAWVLSLWVVVALMARFVPFRNDFAFTSLQFYEPRLVAGLPTSVTPWANFDGVHYLNKATHSLLLEPRFLPLYPALIAVTSFGFFDGRMTAWQVGAGLVISWAALVVAVWFLYKLLRMDYSKNVAMWTIALLISFPTAFFFTGIYTESLFLCVAVLVLFTAKKSYFRTSLLLVAVASMIRLPGILLLAPVVWQWWEWRVQTKQKMQWQHFFDWKFFPEAIIWLGLAVTPLVVMMLVLGKYVGDPLVFLHAHGELANGRATTGMVFPLIAVWRYAKILLSVSPGLFEWWIALLEITTVVAAGVGVYWLVRLKTPVVYVVYTLSMVALPLLSGTFTGFPRYVLMALPLFLVAAQAPKQVRWVLVTVWFALQLVVATFFSRGYFVA